MIRSHILITRSVGIAVLWAILLFMPPVEAQPPAALTLKVQVTGARNIKGKIRAALFEGSTGFPSDTSRAVQTQAADIDATTLSAQIIFTNLQDGVYAVSVFHDENMNEKLDKNFLGIPKEGYGASNNPKRRMRPPEFEETKFQLGTVGQPLEIKLRY